MGKDRRQGNGEDSGRDFASWAKNVRRGRVIEGALKVRKMEDEENRWEKGVGRGVNYLLTRSKVEELDTIW